jgi:isoleucyl-tRNA synthetase
MKAVAAAIATAKTIPFECEGFEITADDVVVTRSPKSGLVVASEGAIVVGLETALTPELIAEGLAREFVSHVQSMRKEADFEVTQRIVVTVETDPEMSAALERYIDYVKNETLTREFKFGANDSVETELNGHSAKIKIEKVS